MKIFCKQSVELHLNSSELQTLGTLLVSAARNDLKGVSNLRRKKIPITSKAYVNAWARVRRCVGLLRELEVTGPSVDILHEHMDKELQYVGQACGD